MGLAILRSEGLVDVSVGFALAGEGIGRAEAEEIVALFGRESPWGGSCTRHACNARAYGALVSCTGRSTVMPVVSSYNTVLNELDGKF